MNTNKRFTNGVRIVAGLCVAIMLAACAATASTQAPVISAPTQDTAQPITTAPPTSTALPTATVPPVAPDTPSVSASDTPTAEPAATLEPGTPTPVSVASLNDDLLATLRDTLQALARVKSYRATQTISSTLGPITQQIEYVAPNTTHVTSTISGRGVVEHIIISDTLYLKSSTGWVTSTSPLLDVLDEFNYTHVLGNIDKYMNSVVSVTSLGSDTVNGIPTHVYQYLVRTTEVPLTSTVTLWQGADNLPVRIDSEASVEAGGVSITAATSALFNDYNTDIKIMAPAIQ